MNVSLAKSLKMTCTKTEIAFHPITYSFPSSLSPVPPFLSRLFAQQILRETDRYVSDTICLRTLTSFLGYKIVWTCYLVAMFFPSLQSSVERDCDFICPTGNIHMRESRLIHPVCLQCRHLDGHCTVANADWSGEDWRGPPDCRDRHKNTEIPRKAATALANDIHRTLSWCAL